MNDGDTLRMVWYAGALVLVVSAVVAQRPNFSSVVRAILGWAAIGAVAWIAVAHRYELRDLYLRATAALGIDSQQVHGDTVRIRMSPDGHFWATARINGVERRMLIDSGATTTALSEATAAAAAVSANAAVPAVLETANGRIVARQGSIAKLELGPLSTEHLGAVVAPEFGDLDVLGMNFLSRLRSWRVEGNVLILDPGKGGAPADPPPVEGDGDARK